MTSNVSLHCSGLLAKGLGVVDELILPNVVNLQNVYHENRDRKQERNLSPVGSDDIQDIKRVRVWSIKGTAPVPIGVGHTFRARNWGFCWFAFLILWHCLRKP